MVTGLMTGEGSLMTLTLAGTGIIDTVKLSWALFLNIKHAAIFWRNAALCADRIIRMCDLSLVMFSCTTHTVCAYSLKDAFKSNVLKSSFVLKCKDPL